MSPVTHMLDDTIILATTSSSLSITCCKANNNKQLRPKICNTLISRSFVFYFEKSSEFRYCYFLQERRVLGDQVFIWRTIGIKILLRKFVVEEISFQLTYMIMSDNPFWINYAEDFHVRKNPSTSARLTYAHWILKR